MRIAPDVEHLMWIAAESADPVAIADFESRFPHLKYELSKRIDMVRKLKQSGKLVRHEGSIPRFMPAPRIGSPVASRVRWSVAAIALSALAVGSFFGTKMLSGGSAPERVPLEPVELPAIVKGPDERGGARENSQPIEIDPSTSEGESGVVQPEDEPLPTPSWQKPIDVKLDRIGLATALRAISAQSGLQIEMPPDMPNPEIAVNYPGMTAIEILVDMASQYGFTVFEQGDGKVLIIPAKQNKEPSASTKKDQNAPLRIDQVDERR